MNTSDYYSIGIDAHKRFCQVHVLHPNGDTVWKGRINSDGYDTFADIAAKCVAHTPDFLALCVRKFGGHEYRDAVLFTLTSLDGQTLEKSPKIRVYHGFGDAQLHFRGQRFEIPREKTLVPASGPGKAT